MELSEAREMPSAGPGRKRDAWLVFSNLAAPIAWFAHLCISFLLVPIACGDGGAWSLYLTSGIALALSISAGLIGVHVLRALPPRNDPASWAFVRARFMARLGVASSILFTLAIAAAAILPLLLGCGTP